MGYLNQAPQDVVIQFLIEHRWLILTEAQMEDGPIIIEALAPTGFTMRFFFRDGFLVSHDRGKASAFKVDVIDLPGPIEITGP